MYGVYFCGWGLREKKEVVQQARNNPQNQGPIISCVPFSKGSVLRLGGFPEAGKLKEREGRDEKEVRRDKGVKKKNVSHVQGDHLEGGKTRQVWELSQHCLSLTRYRRSRIFENLSMVDSAAQISSEGIQLLQRPPQ